jgi:hypothetical protein
VRERPGKTAVRAASRKFDRKVRFFRFRRQEEENMKSDASKLIPGVISAAIWITLLTLFLASLAHAGTV